MFDGGNDKIITYNLKNNSISNILISASADQVTSVFGYKEDGTLIVKTDDFSETAASAKRFATVTPNGDLTRVGSPLVGGSEYPQGNAYYDETKDTIYTISNNSTKRFSTLNLLSNTPTGVSLIADSIEGLSADGKYVYAIDSSSTPQRIIKIDLENSTSTIFAANPPSGYDALGSAHIDASSNTLTVILGKSGGNGVATYDLSTGLLKNTIDTTLTSAGNKIGRFVNSSLTYDVATGTKIVSKNINSNIAKIIKVGAGNLEITGTNSSSGGVDVEAGTLKVSGSDNLGSGEVSLEGGELEISTNTTLTNAISSSSDDSTIDTSSNSVTASGTLSGSKEINKSGTGTLTLTGTLNNTGGIDIKSGTLIANGTGVTPVTVTSGTLQGSGTIGNLTSSSFVAPGNSIGTLNVTGNVTLNSGSILVIEVNADGTSDKIIATGNANLGGVLRISPEAGTYNASSEYTFLTASNVSGTFSNVVLLSCSGGDTVSTTYGASSVKVTLSSCTIKSTNANIIKSYINDLSANASGDLSSAITELNTLSGATYDAAINQLDHDMTGAVTFVGQQQISKINSIIEKQLNASEEKKDHPEKTEQKNSWGQAYGVSGKKKISSDKEINGYEYQFSGIILGSDFLVGEDIYGATASIIETDITSNNNEGKSEYTSIALTGYNSAYLQSGNKLNTKLSFVTNLVKSKRYLNFGSISRTATAKYKTYVIDIGLNLAAKPINIIGGNLNTNLNSGITYNYQSGFTETGANSLNLKVNSKGVGILRAGIDQTYTFNNKIQSLSPFVNWGVNISQQLNSPSSVQALQNQQSFTITDNKRTNIIGQVGFGITKEFSNSSEFNFSATQKFLGGLNETSAMLKYIKTF
jgi:autotransporter-associated beta strand protein